jgi:hypothetical protein
MFTSVFRILSAAVVVGIVLAPGAASAAMLRPAAPTYSSSNTPAAGDPPTTVTFTVTTGMLSMTVPDSANLSTGTGAPGTTISGALGNVTVTDDRALLTAAWTVTAAETNWHRVGGTSTPAEIIPASRATYDPGDITTTGTITAAPDSTPPIALGNGAVAVVQGTAGIGNNTATWDPTIAVAIPAGTVGGDYTGTLTQSVA